MTDTRPARVERDGTLAAIWIEHPPPNLFGTEDLRNAVRTFWTEGPGKATFEGR
jgi:hypothetical protein